MDIFQWKTRWRNHDAGTRNMSLTSIRKQVCYLPTLLPDELLYSLLGRLVAYNALDEPRSALALLFGTKDIIPTIDLPTRLVQLHRRIGPFQPWSTPKDLVNATTLYPYHRPFLADEREKRARAILLYGGGKGLKTLVGRVANRFGASAPLRYCPLCTSENLEQHGVPYWHREHQLPGVTCCAIHRVDLLCDVDPSAATHRQRFHLPPLPRHKQGEKRQSDEGQIWLAALSTELLNAALPVISPMRRKALYEQSVLERGLVRNGNRVDLPALADAVRVHYGDFHGFLHRERLLATAAHPLGWLHSIFQRPATAVHPICHLLLIGFLYKEFAAFRQALEKLGSVAESVDHPASQVDFDQRPRAAVQDALLRNTSVSCRYVARQLNVSVTTVVSLRRALDIPIAERRKSLLAARIKSIEEDLEQGFSPQSVAGKHGISISSVYRLLRHSPQLNSVHRAARHEQLRAWHRQRWAEACADKGANGIQFVRKHVAATYAWLYRNDRSWLRETCHAIPRVKRYVARLDWAKRDASLCARLEAYVAHIKVQQERPRISRTLMLRRLGDAMVRSNCHLLPRLWATLRKLEESVESFQMHRIDRAIATINMEGLSLSLWRVQRVAGIKRLSGPVVAYLKHKLHHLSI